MGLGKVRSTLSSTVVICKVTTTTLHSAARSGIFTPRINLLQRSQTPSESTNFYQIIIGSYSFCFFFFFFRFFFGKAQAVTRRLCSGICLFLLMLFARAYATFRRFCLNFAFFFVGKYAFSSQLVKVQQYPTWYTFYGRCRSIYSADCSGLLCW